MAAISGRKTTADATELDARVRELEAQLKAYKDAETRVKEHIKTFDELDFEVFSHQKWEKLDRSHAGDIRVIWPDGHDTRGIGKHIEDLKMMFIASRTSASVSIR